MTENPYEPPQTLAEPSKVRDSDTLELTLVRFLLVLGIVGCGVIGVFATIFAYQLRINGDPSRNQWLLGLIFSAISMICGIGLWRHDRRIMTRIKPEDPEDFDAMTDF